MVAGLVDDIGLVEEIDQELGSHKQERLNSGEAAKATQSRWTAILDGLGFVYNEPQ
jgi:hypothetical protein